MWMIHGGIGLKLSIFNETRELEPDPKACDMIFIHNRENTSERIMKLSHREFCGDSSLLLQIVYLLDHIRANFSPGIDPVGCPYWCSGSDRNPTWLTIWMLRHRTFCLLVSDFCLTFQRKLFIFAHCTPICKQVKVGRGNFETFFLFSFVLP